MKVLVAAERDANRNLARGRVVYPYDGGLPIVAARTQRPVELLNRELPAWTRRWSCPLTGELLDVS